MEIKKEPIGGVYALSLGFISQNILVIIMRREKSRPVGQNDQLDEAVRIEDLMAARWTKREIAEGLEREEKYVESVVRRRRGISFGRRRVEVMQEVSDASIKAEGGDGRPPHGASLSRVQKVAMGIRLGKGDEDAKAARLERIRRLMAVGFGIDKIAKVLDMSESGLKQFIYDTGTTFKDMENSMTLAVTMASVRAGRPTETIARQLGITQRTLLSRLGGMKISLGNIRKEVRQESPANTGEKIGEYLSQELGKIPEDAPARWQKSGATTDPDLYQQVFLHMMEGKPETSFRYGGGMPIIVSEIADVVLPDVRQRRRVIARRVYELIQVPGVGPNEREVFRLIAVMGMTNGQARETFGERNVDIKRTKRYLIKKIPELAPLLQHHGRATEQ